MPTTADELVRTHAGLVRRLAAALAPRRGMLDAEDLAQEGFLALPRVADAYDPSRGTALSTWLNWRLRGVMLDALRRADHLSRPHRRDVREGRLSPVGVCSLENVADPGAEEPLRLAEVLADRREPAPGAALEAADLVGWLAGGLGRRDAEFFRRRFLGGETLRAAAAAIGLCENSGCHIHHELLERCRERAEHLARREREGDVVRQFARDRHGRGTGGTIRAVGADRVRDAPAGGEALAVCLEAAQSLRNLLRDDGATLTYEQARMHLGEDGMSCTRQEYEAAWLGLHGGADVRGRRRLPPGHAPAGQPEPESPPAPVPAEAPAESEGEVSETNGVGTEAPGKAEANRRLRELVREMGPAARHADVQRRAQDLGLPHSDATVNRARNFVFPGREKNRPGPAPAPRAEAPGVGFLGATRQAETPTAPAPAPPPPAPAPAVTGGLALAVEVQRQLAELRRQVEALGGKLSYRLALSFSEEVG